MKSVSATLSQSTARGKTDYAKRFTLQLVLPLTLQIIVFISVPQVPELPKSFSLLKSS